MRGSRTSGWDMTSNQNTVYALRYLGTFTWGDLESRLSLQETDHTMNMGTDRFSYSTGMPMLTSARNRGASLQANLLLSERDTLRLGAEYQYYTLYDDWPPVGGVMGPNTFWNIDFGEREKTSGFAEWEARWRRSWVTQVGVRAGVVRTNAGPVEGYDNGLSAAWGNDAAAFNASARAHADPHLDVTVMTRFDWGESGGLEGGYARKTRSPNLYQRYTWSTNPMAALMNNTAGDGNGYVGNVGLQPEVANTVSLSGDWHEVPSKRWSTKLTGYFTYVQNYIDARRCTWGQCSAANAEVTTGFVLLQYVNREATLYGADGSFTAFLGRSARLGDLTAAVSFGLARGQDVTTGDNLYGIMPPNAKLAVTHELGSLATTAEAVLIAGKTAVSQVRDEMTTGGYGLLNLRLSYNARYVALDAEIENLLDQLYQPALGGAYVGQGPSMSTNTLRWGVPVPGRGRSFNLAVTFRL